MLKLVLLSFFFVYGDGKTDPNPISAVISNQVEKYLMNSNPEILQFASEFDFSFIFSNSSSRSVDPCTKSIEVLERDAVAKDKYALAMLDSWGKRESGILDGNLKWIGLYHECINAQPTEFKPKYCSVSIGKPSAPAPLGMGTPTGITFGGCYPETCSASDISSLYEPFVSKENLSVKTTCLSSEDVWDTKDVMGLRVLLSLIAVIVASTLYDYITSRRDAKKDSNLTNKKSLEIRHKVLISFSILSNAKKLLSTDQPASDISCLHGMRYLSMCWVLLFRTFLIMVTSTNNLLSLARYYIEHWEFQLLGNGAFSVDAFFFFSGLLAAYHGLQKLVKRNGKMHVLRTYFDRYVRLTPPYALIILISVSMWPKFGSGPIWAPVAELQIKSCEKYWYSNLLYFNNIYPSEMTEECCPWTWYLANDFQFHLLAPIFIYLLYTAPILGLVITSLVTLSSITATGVFSWITKQQPTALHYGAIFKGALNPTVPSNSGNYPAPESLSYSNYIADLYTKPWCRLGAFLVGMITGYIISTYRTIRMPKLMAFAGWILAAGVACAILFGLYPTFSKSGTPVAESLLNINTAAFYNAVSRPVWTMVLAWITIACVNGYGGPVNVFLSWKGFIPLSRLTYCIYLIHPLVLGWFMSTSETFHHFTIQLFIMVFCSTLILCNLFGFLLTLIMEIPAVNLLKLWQNNRDLVRTNTFQTKTKKDE